MSDKQVKTERSKVKDKRQQLAIDSTPKRKPSKKKKPIVVEYRLIEGKFPMFEFAFSREWAVFGRYRTEEVAETVIKNGKRKCDYFEYRVVSAE